MSSENLVETFPSRGYVLAMKKTKSHSRRRRQQWRRMGPKPSHFISLDRRSVRAWVALSDMSNLEVLERVRRGGAPGGVYDISDAVFSKVLRGLRVDPRFAKKLARVLKCSVEDLTSEPTGVKYR